MTVGESSAEAERALWRVVGETNVRRLRVILPMVLGLHALGSWTALTTPRATASRAVQTWLENLWHLHAVAIVVATSATLIVFGARRSARLEQIALRIAPFVVTFYLLWAPLVSANAQLVRPNVDVFVFAMISMSAFFLTPFAPTVAAQALSAAIMLAALFRLQSDPAVLRSTVLNVACVSIGAAFLSRILSTSFRRAELDRRTIELDRRTIAQQKHDLEALNRELEARVERKARELIAKADQVESLGKQLQAKVRDRSDALARALDQLHEGRQSAIAEGTILGDRVKLLGRLGEGGMGTVQLGEDLATGELVAVKIALANDTHDMANLQRFLRESLAAASIEHPAIAKTLHVDVSDGGALFQMQEFVRGVTLSNAVNNKARFAVGDVARFGALLADALSAAHAAGIVHRDVKPSNVMLTASAPGIKLLDFGIAKVRATAPSKAQPSEPTTHARTIDNAKRDITRTHEIVGTPEYMSPEQILTPTVVDDRTDVYALGLLLYRLVEGRSPFRVSSVGDYLMAHPLRQPDAMSDEVPPAFSGLVAKCLAKDPSDRPSAAEVASLLTAIADDARAAPFETTAEAWIARAQPAFDDARPKIA